MLKLVIFKMQEESIFPFYLLNHYISLEYTKNFDTLGEFKLVVPYNEEVLEVVSRQDGCEKLILLEDNIVGICQKINPKKTSNEKTITIQGNLAEGILDNYIVPYVSRLVDATTEPRNLLNLYDSLTYIKGLTNFPLYPAIKLVKPENYNASDYIMKDGYNGGYCTYRSYIEDCCKLLDKGYTLNLNSGMNGFDLILPSYSDRTIGQTKNSPVILSTQLGDISEGEYTFNSLNYKNIVFVRGTYNNTLYTTKVTYDKYGSWDKIPIHKRRMSYIEAQNISGDGDETLTDKQVQAALRREGKQALYAAALVSEYTCKLNLKNSAFAFNKDYFLGDYISVQDTDLGVTVKAQFSGYTKTFTAQQETFEPIVGISQPSLTRILKSKGVI